jgi:DNA-3-methyladenine glycosylase II
LSPEAEALAASDPVMAKLVKAYREPDRPELRTAVGLSHAKVVYLRSLAEHVQSGELGIDELTKLSDEDAIAALTALKGIGTWSAHVFLMFTLGRSDVLPVGDLGIRRAVQRAC